MEHPIFLNNLNRALREVEQEIVERVIVYLREGEEKLQNGSPFTTDYEVEARVDYFLRGEDDPAHTYWTHFDYQDAVVKKDYNLLLDNDDWSEGGMPPLDSPCCYLMHDLYFHSRLKEKLFDIENIWTDVVFRDQKGIRLEKNG